MRVGVLREVRLYRALLVKLKALAFYRVRWEGVGEYEHRGSMLQLVIKGWLDCCADNT